MNRSVHPTDDVRPSALAFWTLTVLYVAIATIAVIRNWDAMIVMDPNEWGDVAAGVFSPLAFLWFLFTALAQRAELRLQHQELRENVQSQREQEEQMGRQADALQAQVAWQKAQITAQFEPVLVLKSSSGEGTGTRLEIENLGCTVLDVEFTHGTVRHMLTRGGTPQVSPNGKVLPYWLSNHRVQVDIGQEARVNADPANNWYGDLRFTMTMKRLDTTRVQHTYLALMREQRMVLESVREIQRAV